MAFREKLRFKRISGVQLLYYVGRALPNSTGKFSRVLGHPEKPLINVFWDNFEIYNISNNVYVYLVSRAGMCMFSSYFWSRKQIAYGQISS
jgi:hypothetical protein